MGSIDYKSVNRLQERRLSALLFLSLAPVICVTNIVFTGIYLRKSAKRQRVTGGQVPSTTPSGWLVYASEDRCYPIRNDLKK